MTAATMMIGTWTVVSSTLMHSTSAGMGLRTVDASETLRTH